MYKHICKNCNNIFENYFKTAKFCSKNCLHEYKKNNRLIQICPYCNKSFYPHDSKSKYCSCKCRDNARKTQVKCVCENCGITFSKQLNQYNGSKRHFCSKECWHNFEFWSDDEIKILTDNYLLKTNEEISEMLKNRRTPSSIKGKAMTLGLGINNKWKDEEIHILLQYYETQPMYVVCNMLPNRTQVSIIGKAKSYNLISYFNRNKEYSQDEDDYILTNYNKKSNIEIAKELNRTPTAICNRLQKLGLHRKNELHYSSISEYIRKRMKHWVKNVIANNGSICQLSGVNQNIVLHHIYGFNFLVLDTIQKLDFKIKDSINDYTKNELDLLYKTFLSIQDKKHKYICICEDIHKQFHSMYGYGNNTEQQWNEFVALYNDNKL